MTTTGGTTTVAYTRDAFDRITERKVNGTKIGSTATFDPNGNQTSGTTADNSTGNFDNRWLGQYQRPTETEPGLEPIIEMGARQYSTRLGRFLETDPVTGGSANAYTYTFGDPNNTNDITGKCPDCAWVALYAAYAATQSSDPLVKIRPLDHTWQMLAIFPHPPEEPRHELVNVEAVVNTIVGAVNWVTKHPVQAAYYAAACYSMGTLMGPAGGAWGFGLAGPLGAAIGWPAGYVSGCTGGIAAAENGGIVGP